MPPAKPATRPYRADESIERLEHEWWETNAALVAKVWEMHPEMSLAARRSYLRRAREFLTTDVSSPAHVLELGCGSGWVGQSICGPDLLITGTDFSSHQIGLAEQRAQRLGLDRFTNYQIAESGEWPNLSRPVTGVLIHAFLHHLDGAELDGFWRMLANRLTAGTKIWVYEPAFHIEPDQPIPRPSRLHKLATSCVSNASKIFRTFDLLDRDTKAAVLRLFEEADAAGRHLSPKEVPFDIAQLSTELAPGIQVVRSYWATAFIIGWLFEANLLRSPILRRIAAHSLGRFLAMVDGLVVKDESYMRRYCVAPRHAFRVWECVLA